MERKLKFSAYDRYEEKWTYAEKAYELYELFYGYSDGQLKWLRQYTGMEEIDGKEVYQGDIIQNRHGGHFLVKYEEQSARWVGKNDKGWIALDDLLEATGQVVGNKFEDPELLRKLN